MYSSDDTALIEKIAIYIGVALVALGGTAFAVIMGYAKHAG
jgi:hypothetical protein